MCSCLVPSDRSTLGYLINAIVYSPSSAERLTDVVLKDSPSHALRRVTERLKSEFKEVFSITPTDRTQRDAALKGICDRLRADDDEHHLFLHAARMIATEAGLS